MPRVRDIDISHRIIVGEPEKGICGTEPGNCASRIYSTIHDAGDMDDVVQLALEEHESPRNLSSAFPGSGKRPHGISQQ